MRLPISSLILVGRRGRNHEISKKATRRVQTHRSSLRGRGLDVWGIGDYPPPKPLLRIFPGQRISPQRYRKTSRPRPRSTRTSKPRSPFPSPVSVKRSLLTSCSCWTSQALPRRRTSSSKPRHSLRKSTRRRRPTASTSRSASSFSTRWATCSCR